MKSTITFIKVSFHLNNWKTVQTNPAESDTCTTHMTIYFKRTYAEGAVFLNTLCLFITKLNKEDTILAPTVAITI